MDSCGLCFYDASGNNDSLHARLRISDVIKDKAVSWKDQLIEYLRQDLKDIFNCEVGFWIQGSYKSHTLIIPSQRNYTFDIDVGIYLFFDGIEEGIEASLVKQSLRDSLESFCSKHTECQVQDTKNACEGLRFPSFLTIDLPIYCMQEGKPKLATNKGWVDSDPKEIQDWLTKKFEKNTEKAQMKRVVRYFKAWVNIQWAGKEHKKIPSLAINVLVANNFYFSNDEEESFLRTTKKICDSLDQMLIVENPLNGVDLMGLNYEDEVFCHQKIQELNEVVTACLEGIDSSVKIINYSNLFEHYFPQVTYSEENNIINLPAIARFPKIVISRYDKNGSHIVTTETSNVSVYKGDSLTFSIANRMDFPLNSEVYWTVRNCGEQSIDANDIGHRICTPIDKNHKRDCAYTGGHTMECMVYQYGVFQGVCAVNVHVFSAKPIRKKSPIFKGVRR
ncbi:TPA: cyclic GMP-AMP synthase DncV-like nucleotidyltransferase [Serratia fonticola]